MQVLTRGSWGFILALGLSLAACSEESTHEREVFGKLPQAATGENDATPATTQPGPNNPADPAATPAADPLPTLALDGKDLYAKNCVSCHGALATSEHAGATTATFMAAIAARPEMAEFKTSLTAEQVTAIGTELAKIVPAPPVVALDGMKLYMDKCMTCHGAKAQTTVDTKTLVAVKAARVNVPAMVNEASTDAEVTAILTYLLAL